MYKSRHDKQLKRIDDFLSKYLNFKKVKLNVSLEQGKGDIDIVICHEKTLIIIEYKSGARNLKKQFYEFVGKKGKMKHFLFNNYHKTKKKYNKCKYLYVAKNLSFNKVESLQTEIKRDPKLKDKVFVLHTQMINELKKISTSIDKEYAKKEFLRWLKIKPENKDSIIVPSLRIPLSKNNSHMYIFACGAKKLLEFAAVSRRKRGKKGIGAYQRLINGKRLEKISKFIDEKKGSFVNNIIIKVDKSKIKFTSMDNFLKNNFTPYKKAVSSSILSKKLDIGILKIHMDYNTAFIIDGQHRLFSYLKARKDDCLNIAGLVNISDSQEANYFLDINDKQKPVEKNLIWDLTGDMSKNSPKGIISNACKNLFLKNDTNNIFYENLTIPSMGNKGFSFAGLCRTLFDDLSFYKEDWPVNRSDKLQKNPFISKDSKKTIDNIAKGICSFFIELNSRIKKEIRMNLYNDAVIAVFCSVAKTYYLYHKRKSVIKKETKNNFFDVFSTIINDYSDEKQKQVRSRSNSAQKKEYKNELLKLFQEKYRNDFGEYINEEKTLGDKIVELEEHFLSWAHKLAYKKFDEDYLKNIFKQDYKKWKNKELKSKRQPHKQVGIGRYLDKIILNDKNPNYKFWDKLFKNIFISRVGYDSKEEIKYQFNKISQYRADVEAHGQDDNWTENDRKLVQVYYDKIIILMKKNEYDIEE